MTMFSNQIDHYQLLSKIGEGGMGEVYKGLDINLQREVALKLLKPELSNREDIVQRFTSEAIALGRLNHPNIAAVYHFGQVDTQRYMALEFVNGETLDVVIKKMRAIPWAVAIRYAQAILAGLAHAHDLNIIHRDIKPVNIMVNGKNTLKVLDFGIARILENARLTKVGHLIGTLEYCSPEQLQGLETDARSDIYAVGVVLYEMLTGHLPFEKDTEFDLIKAHIEDLPKSLRIFLNDIPLALEKIVFIALSKKPEKRFASAAEFSHALQVLQGEMDIKAPSSAKHPIQQFCRRNTGIVFFITMFILSAGYIAKSSHKALPVPLVYGSRSNAETTHTLPVATIAPKPAEQVVKAVQASQQLTLNTSKSAYKIGEALKVQFHVSEPLYVNIVVINSKGKIDRLFPNAFQKNNYCQPHKTYRIPDAKHDFTVTIAGPIGTDKIRAIASPQPIPTNALAFTDTGQFDETKMAQYAIRAEADYAIH